MNVFVHAASSIDRSQINGLSKSAIAHFTNTPVAEVKKISTIAVKNARYQATLSKLGLVLLVSNVTIPKPPVHDLAIFIDEGDSPFFSTFASEVAVEYFPVKPIALGSDDFIILCYAVNDTDKLKGSFGAEQKELFTHSIKQRMGSR